MKKGLKKLVLAKETVRSMEEVALGRLAGGNTEWTFESNCHCWTFSGDIACFC